MRLHQEDLVLRVWEVKGWERRTTFSHIKLELHGEKEGVAVDIMRE